MSDALFERLEETLRCAGAEAGFELLAREFLEQKLYPLLFETRLMQKRRELGLPLILSGPLNDIPEAARPAYEKSMVEVAREIGGLFLRDGDILRAWPYFRAIGDPAPVSAALEDAEPGEGVESLIEIAFLEGVNPRKGFELILRQYGICRAISYFEQFPGPGGREQALHLLLRTLYAELVERLQRAITRVEGQAPASSSVCALMEGRDWLFEGNSYYVDTSHLISVLRFSLELQDPEMLRLALELAEHGKRLGPMYHYAGDPPFEDIYTDHAVYFRALLGEEADQAVAHFRQKVAGSDPQRTGDGPAQVLVGLLVRLGQYGDAIEVSREHLAQADPTRLACPSIPQLCQMAGDYGQLAAIARERGDVLSFAAGLLQSGQGNGPSA
jgi:hypothetical protein